MAAHRTVWLAAGVMLLTACPMAVGDVQSFNASKDNSMYSEDGTLSNGAGQYFFAGRTNNGDLRRGLLAFDVSAIPPGSTITGVTLRLYMSRTQAVVYDVGLHRATQDWGEGASVADGQEGGGATAAMNDATWDYRFFDVGNPGGSPAWMSSGSDFVGTASASISVGDSGSYTWGSTPGMVADVQMWVDSPATNFGWVILGQEVLNQTAKRFNSRTAGGNTSRRPYLEVIFTPPADTGACCYPDGSCLVQTEANCLGAGGMYQGDGTTCTPNPCPQPTGACCFNDGTCMEMTAADCNLMMGAYQGDGTSCMPNPCPIVLGACCFNDGTCLELLEDDCVLMNGTYQGDNTTCTPGLCPVILEPFVDELTMPPVATPIAGSVGGTAEYNIAMVQVQQQLHRDLPPTTLWTYNGTYLGPTIIARKGFPVTVNWINDLRDSGGNLRTDHFLPVDLCPHGAVNEPKTVVHLHGGHVPAEVDGYPEDTFLPGSMESYVYPNFNQDAAMLWYHDHALGITRLNVYLGLAGAYIVRDDVEDALGLPSGEFEVPLVIQDRTFNPDGSLKYPAVWQDHFFGDTMLVNGTVWPFFNVKQAKYRLRFLNGCNSRTLTLAFDNNMSFDIIGSEGGLLSAPVIRTEFTMGPAERFDSIVDFSGFAPGTEILLVNSAPAPFPGDPGVGVITDVMKFVVTSDTGPVAATPDPLRTIEVLDEQDAVTNRILELRRVSDDPCTGDVWLINGLPWEVITEQPTMGDTEIWSFVNRSGIMHPMHMHLVFFQVLDRDTFTIVDDQVVPDGNPVSPPPEEAGWKDTVRVGANEIVRVIARFDDYTGLYPYHCHILEHEDHEMMRQFEVLPPDCPGDANGDLMVDINDLNLVIGNFGSMGNPSDPGDLNGDGNVDINDLNLVLGNFGTSCH